MNDADAIIIGSGHNGLACALMLARAGWKVLVLERAQRPGGAAQTDEVTLPGFHHDLYATNIGLFLGSPIYREFGSQLHASGLEIVSSDHPFCSVFPDGDAVRVYQDADRTLAEFERQSPSDAQAWQELLRYFNDVSPHLLPFLQLPMPSWALARQAYRAYRVLGRKKWLELVQLMLKSPRQFTESWFTSEKVRATFIPWAFHLDFGPDVAGGALFPFLEAPLDHMNGMALAKGGVGHLIASMVTVLSKSAGQVMLGRGVDKIIVQHGRATGVELEGGEKLYAKRAVVANIAPGQLIRRLLPVESLPSSYVQKIREFRYGPGTMMIHLALDGPLDWRAGRECAQFCYVHIAPYVEDVAQTYTDAQNGVLPASPMLVVGQQSAVDKSRAPEGKHTLWIQVRAVPSSARADALAEILPATWQDMKERYADRVIGKIAQYAPNILDKTLARSVLSPEDLERNNPNLVGGDSISGSHHLDQNYIFRPAPGWSRYNTPIAGLFLVGAATWPGGGLNATSGYLLAKQLLGRL
ncbi:MAG: phytoene desaturase family protein [Bacilli bacterium]